MRCWKCVDCKVGGEAVQFVQSVKLLKSGLVISDLFAPPWIDMLVQILLSQKLDENRIANRIDHFNVIFFHPRENTCDNSTSTLLHTSHEKPLSSDFMRFLFSLSSRPLPKLFSSPITKITKLLLGHILLNRVSQSVLPSFTGSEWIGGKRVSCCFVQHLLLLSS